MPRAHALLRAGFPYLKTIDASMDGLAIPEVDDVATLTLDLWAREQGYRRIRASFYL